MRKFKADSSVINTVFYENNNLIIKFNSGAYYKYKGVTEEIFDQFRMADSQGAFFNKVIRPLYPYEKIDFVEPAEQPATEQPKMTINGIPVGQDFLNFIASFADNEASNIGAIISRIGEAKIANIPNNAKIKKITIIEFE